jgi:hypothetical protein
MLNLRLLIKIGKKTTCPLPKGERQRIGFSLLKLGWIEKRISFAVCFSIRLSSRRSLTDIVPLQPPSAFDTLQISLCSFQDFRRATLAAALVANVRKSDAPWASWVCRRTVEVRSRQSLTDMEPNPNLSAIPPEFGPEILLLSGKTGILKAEIFRSKTCYSQLHKRFDLQTFLRCLPVNSH